MSPPVAILLGTVNADRLNARRIDPMTMYRMSLGRTADDTGLDMESPIKAGVEIPRILAQGLPLNNRSDLTFLLYRQG